MTKLRPRGDRVVVEIDPKLDKTLDSGIVLPNMTRTKPQTGRVVAVGPGRLLDNGTREPIDINVGDLVVYSKHAGTEVEKDDPANVDEPQLAIFRELDVLAVVD